MAVDLFFFNLSLSFTGKHIHFLQNEKDEKSMRKPIFYIFHGNFLAYAMKYVYDYTHI